MKLYITIFLLVSFISIGYFVYNSKPKLSPLEAAKADFEKTIRSQFIEIKNSATESRSVQQEQQTQVMDILLNKLTAIQQEHGIVPIPTREVMDMEGPGAITTLPQKIIQEWVPCSSDNDPMNCVIQFIGSQP